MELASDVWKGDSVSMPTKKLAAKKSPRSSASSSKTPPARRWSAKVTTDSTHPDQGLFAKGPRAIAHALASKKVSPKGPASGMRMLNFYINRAGKNLTDERVTALQKAKTILSGTIARPKTETNSKQSSTSKSTAKTKVASKAATH
jgi:tRNA(adenine34) deaminase